MQNTFEEGREAGPEQGQEQILYLTRILLNDNRLLPRCSIQTETGILSRLIRARAGKILTAMRPIGWKLYDAAVRIRLCRSSLSVRTEHRSVFEILQPKKLQRSYC